MFNNIQNTCLEVELLNKSGYYIHTYVCVCNVLMDVTKVSSLDVIHFNSHQTGKKASFLPALCQYNALCVLFIELSDKWYLTEIVIYECFKHFKNSVSRIISRQCKLRDMTSLMNEPL